MIATPLLLLAGQAHAGYPDDVTLSQLGTWNGEPFTQSDTIQSAYQRVVKQLGMTIANTPLGAPETLGISGFGVALTNTVGFIDTSADSAPWRRVHEEADPSRALWVPGLTVRKGLPMSLEAGASLGYIAFSRQTQFGGWGRVGLIEGYTKLPDVALQVGYSGYVGNTELALGVMDTSLSLGKTFPFGRLVGINTASVAPYAGVGLYRIRAMPRISASAQEDLGIGEVSGFSGSDAYTEGFSPLGIHLGMSLRSGDFQISFSGTVSPNVLASLTTGIGYVF